MKKNIKPDVVELINKLQEQIIVMDRKIDRLLSGPAQRPVESRPSPKQDNAFRGRVLHKATCADCKKECEVPFKPSGERPVYCKECFSKRKASSPFKARPDNRPGVMPPAQPVRIHNPEPIEKKKPAAKKKQVSRKKKK